jgi:hypothetical protein
METVLAWLFTLSGTTLVGLGIFLFASDRKFGKQRQDHKFRRNQQFSDPQLAQTRPQIDQLMIKNEELLAQIDSLSNKLLASERTVEELQKIRLGAESENLKLHAANQELQQTIATVTDQLRLSEEMTRELREQLASAESREAILKNRQEQLQFQMITVQREPSSEKEKFDAVEEGSGRPLIILEDTVTANQLENEQERTLAARSAIGGKWSFGIISATVVIAVLSAIAIAFVGTSSDKSFGSKEPAGAPRTGSDEADRRIQAASETPQRQSPSVAGSIESEVSKQTPVAKSAPRLKGAFKTIHPTELFTGPSENSALIATIAPGTEINVVDSRRGWFEIRSNQPRRSGFVRQESAVRIHQN